MLRSDIHYDLTVSQAATEARVTGETIRRWISEGKLRATKTATGTYRIHPRDLAAVLRRSEVMAQPMRGEVMGGQR